MLPYFLLSPAREFDINTNNMRVCAGRVFEEEFVSLISPWIRERLDGIEKRTEGGMSG
jgi:hypothetical protein